MVRLENVTVEYFARDGIHIVGAKCGKPVLDCKETRELVSDALFVTIHACSHFNRLSSKRAVSTTAFDNVASVNGTLTRGATCTTTDGAIRITTGYVDIAN